MGAIVVTENATLDGVIEQVGDWFSPAGGDSQTDDSDIVATLREQMGVQAALLLVPTLDVGHLRIRSAWVDIQRCDGSHGCDLAQRKYAVIFRVHDALTFLHLWTSSSKIISGLYPRHSPDSGSLYASMLVPPTRLSTSYFSIRMGSSAKCLL